MCEGLSFGIVCRILCLRISRCIFNCVVVQNHQTTKLHMHDQPGGGREGSKEQLVAGGGRQQVSTLAGGRQQVARVQVNTRVMSR